MPGLTESNVYSDTDRRMREDADFCAAVHMMMHLAMEHGFTPGELKQIAFRAALEVEMRRPHPVQLRGLEIEELEKIGVRLDDPRRKPIGG